VPSTGRGAAGAHGAVLDQKAGASAPLLFYLRHFPVELAGLRGVFVARLRKGNFLPPEPSSAARGTRQRKTQNGHQRALLLKKLPHGRKSGATAPNSAGASLRPPCLPQPFAGPSCRATLAGLSSKPKMRRSVNIVPAKPHPANLPISILMDKMVTHIPKNKITIEKQVGWLHPHLLLVELSKRNDASHSVGVPYRMHNGLSQLQTGRAKCTLPSSLPPPPFHSVNPSLSLHHSVTPPPSRAWLAGGPRELCC
jgi:hypothetical protein